MRISDWSSDVCSSDLIDLLLGQATAFGVVKSANSVGFVGGALGQSGLKCVRCCFGCMFSKCCGICRDSLRFPGEPEAPDKFSQICRNGAGVARWLHRITDGDFSIHRRRRARLDCMSHRVARKRSEENKSELQSLQRNSYAVFCLQKKK